MKLIENSNLQDWNYIKRNNRQIRLKEKRSVHVEKWRNRLFRECRARTCQEIDEIRRICWEGTDRARHLKFDELSVQRERDPDTVSQLLTLIQDSHNKVNSLSDARDFHDPETASISGASHVPSQPLTIPSPRGMPSRDSGLPLDTRSTSGTSRKVVESLPRDGPSSALFGIIFSRIETGYCRKHSGT